MRGRRENLSICRVDYTFFYLIARCNFSPRFSARFRVVCISQPDIRNVRVNHLKPLLAQAMKNFSRPSIDTPPLPPPPKRTIFGRSTEKKPSDNPARFGFELSWCCCVFCCWLFVPSYSRCLVHKAGKNTTEMKRQRTENISESPRKFVYRVKSRN